MKTLSKTERNNFKHFQEVFKINLCSEVKKSLGKEFAKLAINGILRFLCLWNSPAMDSIL